MKTIWKYPLNLLEQGTKLGVPKGAVVRHIGTDPQNDLCVWLEVDKSEPWEERKFAYIGTGHEVPDGEYLGSTKQGAFIWHVYEVTA